MFEHGIDDREQLAHASHEGDLLGFAGSTQALIEGANDRIEACGHDRCHVERRPDVGAPTPDRAATAQRPGWREKVSGVIFVQATSARGSRDLGQR